MPKSWVFSANCSRVALRLAPPSAALLLAACATVPILPGIAIDVVQSSGFRIKPPWASAASEGVKFRGWACRAAPLGHMSPRAMRVERLASDQTVAAAATGRVQTIPPRAGCSLYDIRTNWRPDEVSSIRICRDEGKPCPAPPPRRGKQEPAR